MMYLQLQSKIIEINFDSSVDEPGYDSHLFFGIDSWLPLINVACIREKTAIKINLFYNVNYCKDLRLEEEATGAPDIIQLEKSLNLIMHDIQIVDDLVEDKELIKILFQKKLGDFPVNSKNVSLLFGKKVDQVNDWDSLESVIYNILVTPKSQFKFPEEKDKLFSAFYVKYHFIR